MARTPCTHAHGDTVEGIWICGQCWQKLDERPRKYMMVSHGELGERQECIPAPIRIAASGLTLSEFIGALARRLMVKASMKRAEAIEYALDIMSTHGIEFGHRDEEWTASGAWDLVQEDMQCWDAPDDEGNE